MKPFAAPSDKPLDLPPRPRVLVVALRRLGDVLLATPLIASIRCAFPQARIDALVFADTAGMLAGNPDLDRIVTMPPARGAMASLALALRLFKRYDLAVSTQSGDRPTFFALLAGRRHVGPIDGGRRGALRRRGGGWGWGGGGGGGGGLGCIGSKKCFAWRMRWASHGSPAWCARAGPRRAGLPPALMR
jgi:hypothetical protein